MLFKVRTLETWYTDRERKLLETINFRFKFYEGRNMFKKVSDSQIVEIKSIEDLYKFVNKFGSIVVNQDSIIIYDGLLEG